MSRFIETFGITEGRLPDLSRHAERISHTMQFFYGSPFSRDIQSYLPSLNEIQKKQTLRCTLFYSESIESVRITEYSRPNIKSLKIVRSDSIDYSFKYADRSELSLLFEQRDGCDDILILKNGKFTDSLFANLAFFDGKNYFTPEQPLLRGTRRSQLLEEGRIREMEIGMKDLSYMKSCSLINAMLNLNDCTIDISEIY